MNKEIKYKITSKRYIVIKVNNENEVNIINLLNSETTKERFKIKTYYKNTISFEQIANRYQFVDESKSIIEQLIETEIKEIVIGLIVKLPPRQKQVIVDYFYNDKSLRKIAKENSLNLKTVRESFYAALNNIKKEIK